MKLRLLTESRAAIVSWDENSDDHYDPWIAMDQAEKAASLSGIRISRNKELKFIAISQDQVVGGVWVSFAQEMQENPAWIYDFDVAVHPQFRNINAGVDLIDAAINDYKSEASGISDQSMIRVWVVNPKLIGYLERAYGFEIEDMHEGESAHMIKY